MIFTIFLITFSFPICSSAYEYGNILMKPYLQAVTENSITVMCSSKSKDEVTVFFAEAGSMQYQSVKSTKFEFIRHLKGIYIHRTRLAGLKPNTQYTYKIVQGKDSVEGCPFWTAPTEGTPFRISVSGDNRSNPDVHNNIISLIAKRSPHMAIFTGDLCYDGSYKQWMKEFFYG